MTDMTGQVALVTGGVRGIGIAICERLIQRGVLVTAGYSRNEQAANEFLEAHEAQGAGVAQGNIAHPPDCERVIKEIVEQHGRLDIVVNTAGITVDRTVR